MSADSGADSNLDAVAAQVRAHPPMGAVRLAPLLEMARREPHGSAFNTIVEHHLGISLSAALGRAGQGIDVIDLFQEGCIAVVEALEEFTARDAGADRFGAFVERVVALHLDAAIEREAAEVAAELQLARDAETLQSTRITLGRELRRPPTDLEVGGVLRWTAARVASVGAAVRASEERHDAEIIPYLDDADIPADGSLLSGGDDDDGAAPERARRQR